MQETVAQKKYSCPSCGAQAQWNPSKQALVCAYCGTTSPAQIRADGEIVEHDLVKALRGIPDSRRGWNAQKVSVKCQSCNAISIFDQKRVAQNCDFCGSAQMIKYEDVKEVFRPESMLPFKISETQVREAIRRWYGSRWFAPNKLGGAALTDRVHGAYLPYWTFDAHVRAQWTAESGYYYYETESYVDNEGRRQSRLVRRIRWEYSSGQLEHFFDDELVAASTGVNAAKLRAIEPFPTQELVPYDAGYVAGWVVERYQIDLVKAAQASREAMEKKLYSMCEKEVPGDTRRNLNVDADYSGQTFKHILLPIWLLSYSYGARKFQVVINGYTGKIAGDYPKSWIKITLAILIPLLVVALIAFLAERY
ncbi:MAG TPA: zinc ribbon domain-containing protein [Blastocatellia bacterium]